jgi:phage major head subunit gpT-like protein
MAANADLNAALAGHNTSFQVMVQDMLAAPDPGKYGLYTETVNGGAAQVLSLAYTGATPTLRRWEGARVYKDPRAYTTSIQSYPYEATMPLNRMMVQFDQSGAVGLMLKDYAGRVVEFFDQVSSDAYRSNSGVGPLAPDGVALFSASHTFVGSAAGTGSNLSASTNLTHSNLVAAETTGALLTEENGRSYRIAFDELMVGARKRRAAMELVGSDRVVIINQTGVPDTVADGPNLVNAAATRTNVLGGDYTVVVDARDTGYHWTLRDSKRAKPIVLFITRAPEIINQDTMESTERFANDRFVMGVEADVGTGGWFWPAVHRGTGTA